jgi:Ca2+:H+ antiporter
MNVLLREIRHNPLLWMLVFVPAVLVANGIAHSAHTLLFLLAVLAIVPLAAVCTENLIRVDAVMESPKLAE